MDLLSLSALLFGLAIAGGLTMLALRIRRQANPPIAIATLHGGAVGFAIATLAIAVLDQGEGGLALAALVVFGLAALGGATLFTLHMRGRLLPVPLILVHGSIASIGFVLLVVHLLSR